MQNNKKGAPNFKSFWLPMFLFVIAVISFFKIIDKLDLIFSALFNFLNVISPFIWGLAIAFLLYKPAFALEQLCLKSKKIFFKKRARGISVLSCYLALAIVLGLILYLLLPKVFSSAMALVQNLPQYYSAAIDYVKKLAGQDGKVLGFDITGFLNSLSLSAILKYFDFSAAGKYMGEILGVTSTFVDVLLAFVVSVYVLLGRNHLLSVAKRLLHMVIPKEKVSSLGSVAVRSAHIFYNYIYSQLIDAVIVAAIMSVIFYIIGLPYALLLGILMGVCNVIPYFGALIGGGLVIIISLISSGDILKAVITLILVIVVQQLDANLIQPRIVAGSVGLKPLYVLLAIMVGSGLFGFVGILICVPVTAIIRMLILDYLKSLNGKDTPFVEKQRELAKEKEQ